MCLDILSGETTLSVRFLPFSFVYNTDRLLLKEYKGKQLSDLRADTILADLLNPGKQTGYHKDFFPL